MTEQPVPPTPWIEWFDVYQWNPFQLVRGRGFRNARLGVFEGGFVVSPRWPQTSSWEQFEYRWPAVVLQRLLPTGKSGLLVERLGLLARCSISRGQIARLRAALGRAGIDVIDVSDWGWEEPRPVQPDLLGAHARDVPSCVLRTNGRPSPEALSKSNLKCKKTGAILSTTWRRSGTLAGTFVFKPNLDGLPSEVSWSKIAATVTKTTFTGKTCGGGTTCSTGKLFAGIGSDTSGDPMQVNASAGPKSAYLSFAYSETMPNVTIGHTVSAVVPSKAVTFTSTSLTLKGGSLAPFASGTLVFSLSNPNTTGTTCLSTTYTVTYTSGSVTVAFVNGNEVNTTPFSFLIAKVTKKAA